MERREGRGKTEDKTRWGDFRKEMEYHWQTPHQNKSTSTLKKKVQQQNNIDDDDNSHPQQIFFNINFGGCQGQCRNLPLIDQTNFSKQEINLTMEDE